MGAQGVWVCGVGWGVACVFRVVAYGFIFRVCGVEGERNPFVYKYTHWEPYSPYKFRRRFGFLVSSKEKGFSAARHGCHSVVIPGVGALVWHRCFLSVL